ncbi:LOW QUALITY PROTEIN: zinc finger protein 280C-like [Symphorus nematophorus]
MSELFMECVEEELEPWQKQVPEVNLIDDDDDEPIFVGVLSNNQKDDKPSAPPPPPQRNSPKKQDIKRPAPQPAISSSQIMLPLNIAGNAANTAASNLTTVAPQPVIVNNQGFIVTSPQLTNNSEFIASLGSQYPPGTAFTIVPAGQPQLFQRVAPATVIPGAVHRPQVQQISNNIVTLSNVQSPALYSAQSNQMQPIRSNSQSLQTFTMPVKVRDQILIKRGLTPPAKRVKLDLVPGENGILKNKCPKCQEEFVTRESLLNHMMSCCGNREGAAAVPSAAVPSPVVPSADISANKRIMLVSDFYYGRFDGDGSKKVGQKTNTTFKCQSCLKVLKNNIRFMNHMKHHLELEKQNSESWESHTTCQHCYRQYMTPFQLQCHIESAHSPIESSTNCKICELAFESEQVLLEHMKDNHKPGEMPYVCQVCNYRSSFFSDVETHFRTIHENTKDLLCPFCLKVLKSTHMYMQHYMKHQKKGIHRCGKCRLNFLTYKEKVEHRTHVHKTFRKPRALEGLPPGTKVTIRASLTGKTPTQMTSTDRQFIVSSDMLSLNRQTSPPGSAYKSKSNVAGVKKTKKTKAKKPEDKHNLVLRNLRVNNGRYTCIECNSKVDDFFSHFPMVSNCGACRYRTSCKIAISNHMIRVHSTINKNRFLKMDQKKNPPALKLTLVCLNCDLLADASGGDLMSKHLTDKPNHICKVIQEKDMKAKDRAHLISGQPTNVLYLLTSASAQTPVEMDLKPAESVTPPSVTLPTVSQPEPEAVLPAGDQEKASTETGVIAGSSEEQLEQSSAPALSPSCPSDAVLDRVDESVGESLGHSESLEVGEQLPDSEITPKDDTEEQQTNSELLGPSRNWTYGHQQQRLMSQRESQEQHRQQEVWRLDRDRKLQASLMAEENLESRRHLRQVQQELKERQMESARLQAEEERINKQKQLEQEERMAKEQARINYETQREEKMRQRIIEDSLELRELKSKLRTAYLNKERAAQIAEKEAMRFETMREEADFARKMKSEHERTAVEQQKLAQKRYQELVEYQRELEQQLMERERKRQEAYEEFLKEKLMVDEIVRKIYEEDQMERQLKLEKVRATQQYIEEFKRQQAEWRRMEQEQMEAENRRIMEFASHQAHMEEAKMAKIREREEAKEHLHKILSDKIEEERQQREEMERVREELHLEEQEEANRQREIEEMENKIRQRLMMQRTCQEQMAFKEMRRQAEKEEEDAFRKITMAKFAEDDRIEQMNERKRRMKQLEHKREVEKLLEDRRRQHEADRELEAKEKAIEQEQELLRRQIVEEERQRLLKRHATKLLGYLPKGLLREDDQEHFDEDFIKNFRTHQADILSEDG